ncbi:hypothetical protein OF83DRAFT_1044944, partial [Amylostereum chailletii]
DAPAMWMNLEALHVKKAPGACFNVYDDLFNIHKKQDESLLAMATRVDDAMCHICSLCPASLTLEELDKELTTMAYICALPSEYSSFVSSLLLLEKLDLDSVKDVFVREETNRERNPE